MSLKSQTQTPSLKSLPKDLCSGFLCPEKLHRPQPGLNPQTLDLKASTLPRDRRDRHLTEGQLMDRPEWFLAIRELIITDLIKLICQKQNPAMFIGNETQPYLGCPFGGDELDCSWAALDQNILLHFHSHNIN